MALLGAVTFVAIAVACVATLRARAARAALRAIEEKYGGRIELARKPEVSSGRTDGIARAVKTPPVLVVEDEPNVRELIKEVLGRAGHEVLAVAGPHAALAAMNRQPIALMLVDVVMPQMGGYDLVAEARKISPGVRVVFMSAFARDAARHPAGDGFLAKPFSVASLTAIVEEALKST
jgi:CheY-like chemotaxis protein